MIWYLLLHVASFPIRGAPTTGEKGWSHDIPSNGSKGLRRLILHFFPILDDVLRSSTWTSKKREISYREEVHLILLCLTTLSVSQKRKGCNVLALLKGYIVCSLMMMLPQKIGPCGRVGQDVLFDAYLQCLHNRVHAFSFIPKSVDTLGYWLVPS